MNERDVEVILPCRIKNLDNEIMMVTYSTMLCFVW